jgi:hypothetical protein
MEYVDEPKLIPPEEIGLTVNMKPESELQDSPPSNNQPDPTLKDQAKDKRILVSVDDPDIIFPHYGNDARTKVVGWLRWADQPPTAPLQRMEGEKDTGNKFVHDVFSQYTEEELQRNTKREIEYITLRRKLKREKDDIDDQARRRSRLFKFKTEILDTEEVANAPNTPMAKSLKRKIRKATTEASISAYVAALILHVESLNNGEAN